MGGEGGTGQGWDPAVSPTAESYASLTWTGKIAGGKTGTIAGGDLRSPIEGARAFPREMGPQWLQDAVAAILLSLLLPEVYWGFSSPQAYCVMSCCDIMTVA